MFGLKNLFRRTPRPEVPEALWQQVESALPWLSYLGAAERLDLRKMALEFLDRKVFSGARGFEPDNVVRLSIALQACVPILKLGLSSYDGWSGIVVYPGEFVIPRRTVNEDGLLHEYDEEALGESWDGGPVILTWFDNPDDYAGAEVVVHEFAHKLDQLSGGADGMPPLHSGMSIDDWCDTFEAAFDNFCDKVDQAEEDGTDTAIDPYAAEHPAEFFAVLSEVFFTDPQLLLTEYPAIYQQLALFYRQDPGHINKAP
ncbi:MAG: zinc-dependent peptidase [Rhodocyclaceae bacterium]